MKYTGKLYGKIGRRYIPLKLDSADVDKLESPWVDPKQDLPKDSVEVLVRTETGAYVVARHYNHERYPQWRYEFGELSYKVVQWMPIPPRKKGGDA